MADLRPTHGQNPFDTQWNTYEGVSHNVDGTQIVDGTTIVQTAGSLGVKAGGVGTTQLADTGPGATGPLGDTTHAPVITIDSKGRVTALTSVGITGATSSTFDPVNYGAVHDGTTNDYSAILAAVTAGAGGTVIFGTPGTYFNSTQLVIIPAGTTLIAAPGVIIKGFGFRLTQSCSVEGFTFLNGSTATYAVSASGVSQSIDCRVRNNVFLNYGNGILLDVWSGTAHERWEIAGNRFDNCSGALFVNRANQIDFHDNWVTAPASTSATVEVYGGHHNHIHHNMIQSGGFTGIIFLTRRDINPGPLGMFYGNVIDSNVIIGCQEEYISFDFNGSNAAYQGSVEWDTVSSVSGFVVTLADAGWSGAAGNLYAGYRMCFNTGALAGMTFPITAQTNGAFTLTMTSAQAASISAADVVIIGQPSYGNIISNNFCDGSARGTTVAIMLYGLCYGNSVTGNIVVGKGGNTGSNINCNGVNNGAASGRLGNKAYAPSESNIFIGNVLHNANLNLTYTDLGSGNPSFNSNNNKADIGGVDLNVFLGGSLGKVNQA